MGELMDNDKLTRFLSLVPQANWRHPPAVWSVAVREALSDGLVGVGFGGVMMLTDAGRAYLSQQRQD